MRRRIRVTLPALLGKRRRIVLGDSGGADAPNPDPPGDQLLLEDGTFLLLEEPKGISNNHLNLESST